MKQVFLTQWNWFRLLRLILGMAIVVQGIILRDTIAGIAGLLFAGMAVFNVGCCGSSCYMPVSKQTDNKTQIDYEEIT